MQNRLSFRPFQINRQTVALCCIFDKGLGDAVVSAMEQAGDAEIFVDDGFYHSIVLFYSKIPASEYASTVEYTNYPAEFLSPATFIITPAACAFPLLRSYDCAFGGSDCFAVD